MSIKIFLTSLSHSLEAKEKYSGERRMNAPKIDIN
jgi:hypothetical protein